jgi:hypothetical protein
MDRRVDPTVRVRTLCRAFLKAVDLVMDETTMGDTTTKKQT